MRIGIDIDNVISNFNDVLLNEYIKHDKEINGKGIVKNNVYIREKFDWDKDYEEKFYKSNIEYFASLFEPIKDCSKYIKLLKDEGNSIYIISGRDNGEYSDPYNMTIDWLNKYNIVYDKLFLVDAYNSHSKTEICLEHSVDVMIDDSKRMCKDIKENGIRTLLMDTPYNRDTNEFERVNSWKEIYNTLSNKRINVILDTDTYNECDDQFALAYLIKSHDKFNIEAITVAPYSHQSRNVSVKEGQELSYNEILRICNWLNFDINNKVFKGSMDYIQNGYDETNDAVNKIIEIALKNDKTYVMAIGAITNVALAIKKEPKIIDKIEVIWLGGHSLLQNNNLEFNFRQDVSAVRMVFDSKVKLTIIPCKNVASNLRTSIYELNHYLKDKSELCNYLIDRFYNDGYHGIQERRIIWDVSVIAYMINKDWFTSEDISCPNINDNTSYELTTNNHKITMINYIDVNKVYTDLFEKLGGNDE